MLILQVTTVNPDKVDYTVIFAIIGGFWTIITFVIGFRDNYIKQRTEHIKLIREYNTELRCWADNVVEIMTTAGLLCVIDPQRDEQFYIKRHSLLIALSAEIDKGRFFLPNTGQDLHGQHKPAAYRGFSSEAISAIKVCYRLVKQINFTDVSKNPPLKPEIMAQKRNFVSEVQKQLDPKKFEIAFFGALKKSI